MDDSSERPAGRPSPALVWPTLLLVALAVMGYFTARPALKTARPKTPSQYGVPSPPSPPGIKAVHARLWEDPLEAVYRDPNNQWEIPTEAGISGGVFQAILEALGQRTGSQRERTYAQSVFEHIVLSNSDDDKDDGGRKLLCMPILVDGGPYEDARETRLRTRYAVLAALGTLDFRLALPRRMSYVELPIIVVFRAIDAPQEILLDVPVKLYTKDPIRSVEEPKKRSPYDAVLVCWIDQSQLGDRPLYAVAQVLRFLFPSADLKKRVDVHMLGPSGSDALIGMAKENYYWEDWSRQAAEKMDRETEEPREGRSTDVAPNADREGPTSSGDRPVAAPEPPQPSDAQQVESRGQMFRQDLGVWPAKRHFERMMQAEASRYQRPKAPPGNVGESPPSSRQPEEAEPETSLDAVGDFRDYAEALLFSPRATLTVDVYENSPSKDDTWDQVFAAFFKPSSDRPTSGLRLVRTVGSDEQLVLLLRDELLLRGAWPKEGSGDRILLITERDTLYGRVLPELFREATGNADRQGLGRKDQACLSIEASEARDRQGGSDPAKRFRTFTYLRGLDGNIPGPARAESGTSDRDSQGENNAPAEAAYGTSQVDYLRRLDSQVLRLPKENRFDKRTIKAVGVLGTDIYDKLLVLRALRKSFPGACFFTTDLDARLVDPGEIESTHNLLVASHFGLELSPRLQRDVPAFRDSYQTSTFLAALLALGDSRAETSLGDETHLDPWGLAHRLEHPLCDAETLRPLVYEIGRTRPYQLTGTGGTKPGGAKSVTARVQPASPRELQWFALGTWLLPFAVMGLAVCYPIVRGAIRDRAVPRAIGSDRLRGMPILGSLLLAAMVAVVLSLMALDHGRPNGEPLSFSGISGWPATFLRLLVGWLAVALTAEGWAILKKNERKLRDRYFVPSPQKEAKSATKRRKTGSKERDFRKCGNLVSVVRNVISATAVFAWEKKDNTSAVCLFEEYARRGRGRYRILRTAVYSVAFYVFAAWFLEVTHCPALQYRGGVAWAVSESMAVFAAAAMLVLVFFVTDAVRLCSRFSNRLAALEGGVSGADLKALSREKGYPKKIAAEVFKIRLLADHTRAVKRLIFLPLITFLVLLLAWVPGVGNSTLPWQRVTLMLVLFAIAILAALALRRAAKRARDRVVSRLRDRLAAAITASPDGKSSQVELCRLAIDEVKQERRGAFLPLAQDPIFGVLTIPFGGVGGLLVVEQVFNYL